MVVRPSVDKNFNQERILDFFKDYKYLEFNKIQAYFHKTFV